MKWNASLSEAFLMTNGIRQGSVLSPYLFSLYVDELNLLLSESGLGCHVGGRPLNNFSYADDLAILAPCARALNSLLEICDIFARENCIEFSSSKSVVLLITPKHFTLDIRPNIYLGECNISYVERFKYLGHVLTADFTDDEDIDRERRNLAMRGNVLIRKFHFCTEEVKCHLFKSYCCQFYTCSLWVRYKKRTMDRLRVCHNTIMRRLLKLPPWSSASTMFATRYVRSHQEVIRFASSSLCARVEGSCNNLLYTLCVSDASVLSDIRSNWRRTLYTS